MSRVILNPIVAAFHGKIAQNEPGYFYKTKTGRTFYRRRNEDYHKKPSLRQIWNSQAFAWAHRQLNAILADSEANEHMTIDWRAAHKMNPARNKRYERAQDWKFAMLQLQWKDEHPFEEWSNEYIRQQVALSEEKTEKENVSTYALKNQIKALQDQLFALTQKLNERENG